MKAALKSPWLAAALATMFAAIGAVLFLATGEAGAEPLTLALIAFSAVTVTLLGTDISNKP